MRPLSHDTTATFCSVYMKSKNTDKSNGLKMADVYNVNHFTSFFVNVMFLFLVNTVNLTSGLCRLLHVVFVF